MDDEARATKYQWLGESTSTFGDLVEVDSERAGVVEELYAKRSERSVHLVSKELAMQVSALLKMIAPRSSRFVSSFLARA